MRFNGQQPARGDVRIVQAFLWLPMKIGAETRWLETAAWMEMYFDWQWNVTKWCEPVLEVSELAI